MPSQDTHFPDVETIQTTQDLGDKIISLLKRSTDKNGRPIAGNFLELPDKNEYPEYYQHVAMPISISEIEKNLHQARYHNMTALESDLKRMVQNAKDYNTSGSQIFEDAERIRKALSNFMPKHNPAYLDPEYRAVPTPIPDHLVQKLRDSSLSGSEQPSIKLRINAGGPRRRSTVPSETVEDVPTEELEEIHAQLLDELSAQEDAVNFEEKPSRREIPHYYKVIKQPTSINDVRKKVQKGQITSWPEFAREVRLIWSNAKEYNEPGSSIYEMADALESHFEEKLQAHGVPPKVVPRLSLKTASQPRQLKLKVGTPAPATPATNGSSYTVDQGSLQRQKLALATALDRSNTRESARKLSTPAPAVQPTPQRSVSVVDLDVPMTGMNGDSVKQVEPAPVQPPAIPLNIPAPTLEGEPPRPQLQPSLYPTPTSLTNGHLPLAPQPTPAFQPGIFKESTNPVDRKHRDPHKSASDALLQSITYMTNPLIPPDPHWRLTRHASPTKTQISYYTYLPPTHSSLRIIPDLHPTLKPGTRKYKLFVLNNGTILPASPDIAGGGVYDLHLVPGENVVTVEAIAALPEGERKEYARDHEQFDFERITFYIFLRPKMA